MPEDRGSFGRIAISRENYMKLRGYDEGFVRWGGEDNNFLQRAKMANIKHLRIDNPNYTNFITHSNKDRVVNCVSVDDVDRETNRVDEEKNAGTLSTTFIFSALNILSKLAFSRPGDSIGMGSVEMSGGNIITQGELQDASRHPSNLCARGLPELVRGRLAPRLAEDDEIGHNGLDECGLTHH